MPRRRLARIHGELSEGIKSIEIARAQLFEVDIDRKKRIDATIDYFGHEPAYRRGVRRTAALRHFRLI